MGLDKYRNQLCPCGSKMKYKYCCWSKHLGICESSRPDNDKFTKGGKRRLPVFVKKDKYANDALKEAV